MSGGWKECPLGDALAQIKNGVNCKQDKSGVGDRISRIESISEGTFDERRVGFASLSEAERERYKLQYGDILFSHINSPPHVGKVAFFDTKVPVYHGVNLLLMRPRSGINSRYLYYFLELLRLTGHWERTCKKSVNQASVNQKDIGRVAFRYPDSAFEQGRIVAVLDEAFAAIATATANAEKNLANARELLLGYLNSELSDREAGPWKRVPLGDLCEILDRLRKPVTKSDRRAGEYPYYGATGIVDWVDDYIFDEPLVLLGEDGAKWGAGERSAFSASGKYWVNNHAHIMRPNREVLSDDWLIYYLNMADLMPYITGVTVPKLNQERMRSILIPLPPLETQQEIITRMDAFSEQTVKLVRLNHTKLAHLASLKQSILHRAFSGELIEREPLAA